MPLPLPRSGEDKDAFLARGRAALLALRPCRDDQAEVAA